MWKFGAILLTGLAAGCGSGTDGSENLERIACALGGKAGFAPDCQVERVRQGEKLLLVVRHPDGGFRRFEVVTDGRGLALADGADPGRMTIHGDMVEIVAGRDRYRFPFTARDGMGAPAGKAGDPAKPEEIAVACALQGAPDFAQTCALERVRGDKVRAIVLRHPDGAFRRFDINGDALVAADGADIARVALAGGQIELGVAKDRYRLPAASLR